MRKFLLVLLPTLLAASLMNGCSSLLAPVPAPEMKQYQITSPAPAVENCQPNANAAIMQVAPVKVYAPFDTHNMYYSQAQYQLNSYSQNQWAASPGNMFTQAILEKLQGACIYKNVVSAEFMVNAKYRITTQVMDFKQVISGTTATMTMTVVVHMVDNSSNQVIKGKTFEETSSVSPNIDGYIKGANDVTTSFTNDLATWLTSN